MHTRRLKHEPQRGFIPSQTVRRARGRTAHRSQAAHVGRIVRITPRVLGTPQMPPCGVGERTLGHNGNAPGFSDGQKGEHVGLIRDAETQLQHIKVGRGESQLRALIVARVTDGTHFARRAGRTQHVESTLQT